MRSLFLTAIVLLLLGSTKLYAQKKFQISGHLENMELVWVKNQDSIWQTMNTIYNRLDLRYYPNSNFTFHMGLRNILDYGQIVTAFNQASKLVPGQNDYTQFVANDAGYLDLTEDWSNGTSYTLYSNIDRLNVQYSLGNFEASLGRQRINWGINTVWNPNDIFNTFNYFNFDYVEKPGCDAMLLQYYTSTTASVQAAIKIDHNEDITAAAMYKFNKWNYDFQFLGGIISKDYLLGLGWSGQIAKAGFNGEATYFRNSNNFQDTTGQLVASIGANYTFSNSLLLQISALYNSKGTTSKAGTGNTFAMNMQVSPQTLSPARYSLFARISYPITPLIQADLSGIFNPNDKSGFIGSSVEISLTQDLSFMVMAQVFTGGKMTEYGDYGKLFYLRLKWSL
jgi:hypothetical protein